MPLPPRVDVDKWNAEQAQLAVERHPLVCLHCRNGGDPDACFIFASVQEVARRAQAKVDNR